MGSVFPLSKPLQWHPNWPSQIHYLSYMHNPLSSLLKATPRPPAAHTSEQIPPNSSLSYELAPPQIFENTQRGTGSPCDWLIPDIQMQYYLLSKAFLTQTIPPWCTHGPHTLTPSPSSSTLHNFLISVCLPQSGLFPLTKILSVFSLCSTHLLNYDSNE